MVGLQSKPDSNTLTRLCQARLGELLVCDLGGLSGDRGGPVEGRRGDGLCARLHQPRLLVGDLKQQVKDGGVLFEGGLGCEKDFGLHNRAEAKQAADPEVALLLAGGVSVLRGVLDDGGNGVIEADIPFGCVLVRLEEGEELELAVSGACCTQHKLGRTNLRQHHGKALAGRVTATGNSLGQTVQRIVDLLLCGFVAVAVDEDCELFAELLSDRDADSLVVVAQGFVKGERHGVDFFDIWRRRWEAEVKV